MQPGSRLYRSPISDRRPERSLILFLISWCGNDGQNGLEPVYSSTLPCGNMLNHVEYITIERAWGRFRTALARKFPFHFLTKKATSMEQVLVLAEMRYAATTQPAVSVDEGKDSILNIWGI